MKTLLEDIQKLNEYTYESPVASAIRHRINMQHPDWYNLFGMNEVAYAIEDVASAVGDVEEIGSSDVSIWVNRVGEILNSKG